MNRIHSRAARVANERTLSVPRSNRFYQAVFLSALNYLSILAALTTLAIFLLKPSHLATHVLVTCLSLMAVTWVLALSKRRSTHCPLCKGTPLINSGALPHRKALKIWPFNHGVSAIFSIIATQTFRCMYCGTAFDLMKPPSHLSEKGQE